MVKTLTPEQMAELVERTGGVAPLFLCCRRPGMIDSPLKLKKVVLPTPGDAETLVLCERPGWGLVWLSWECVTRDFEIVNALGQPIRTERGQHEKRQQLLYGDSRRRLR